LVEEPRNGVAGGPVPSERSVSAFPNWVTYNSVGADRSKTPETTVPLKCFIYKRPLADLPLLSFTLRKHINPRYYSPSLLRAFPSFPDPPAVFVVVTPIQYHGLLGSLQAKTIDLRGESSSSSDEGPTRSTDIRCHHGLVRSTLAHIQHLGPTSCPASPAFLREHCWTSSLSTSNILPQSILRKPLRSISLLHLSLVGRQYRIHRSSSYVRRVNLQPYRPPGTRNPPF